MQKVKISVVSPDYNWVICKVYTGFFHTSEPLRGTVNSWMNYWQLTIGGMGFPILRSRGVWIYQRHFLGCTPRRGSDFFANFFSWFPIREAGGFKDLLKFQPPKNWGNDAIWRYDIFFQMGGKKTPTSQCLSQNGVLRFFSQDALSWCEGNIQPTRS